jgi:hypothetical protein
MAAPYGGGAMGCGGPGACGMPGGPAAAQRRAPGSQLCCGLAGWRGAGEAAVGWLAGWLADWLAGGRAGGGGRWASSSVRLTRRPEPCSASGHGRRRARGAQRAGRPRRPYARERAWRPGRRCCWRRRLRRPLELLLLRGGGEGRGLVERADAFVIWNERAVRRELQQGGWGDRRTRPMWPASGRGRFCPLHGSRERLLIQH